jgi:hypothetical protein
MEAQILTDNREQIIEMIKEAISESPYEITLREAMVQVKEYALMGCYQDMDDMEDIIADSIDEINNKKRAEATKSAHWLENKRIESSKKLMRNI